MYTVLMYSAQADRYALNSKSKSWTFVSMNYIANCSTYKNGLAAFIVSSPSFLAGVIMVQLPPIRFYMRLLYRSSALYSYRLSDFVQLMNQDYCCHRNQYSNRDSYLVQQPALLCCTVNEWLRQLNNRSTSIRNVTK